MLNLVAIEHDLEEEEEQFLTGRTLEFQMFGVFTRGVRWTVNQKELKVYKRSLEKQSLLPIVSIVGMTDVL